MSGYNERTGVFELTYTKAEYYFRRDTLPFERDLSMPFMQFVAKLFVYYGYQLISGGRRFIRVRATPAQVWEVLSGEVSRF